MSTSLPTGPGSPQDVPPAPGQFPIDPATLPGPIRDELQAPDPVAIDTASKELKDGLNHCPKCGSTEIRQRAGTDQLICLFCRHQWTAARVEEEFGLGEGIAELKGTQIASGAKDISADAASLRTYKCTGCGAEVVVNTDTAMTALRRCCTMPNQLSFPAIHASQNRDPTFRHSRQWCVCCRSNRQRRAVD